MKIKIGMAGTSQLSFPGPKEEVYATLVGQMQRNAEEIGFDLVSYPLQVITEEDAKKAVAYLEEEKIDFLLLVNVSYSAGFLAPIFYKIKGAAVGIWSIPETRKGPTMFNSFCSNNMYQGINTRYLRDFGIKAKWFYGFADDETFRRRLSVTVRALGAIKRLKSARVALVGGFAPGFNDLYFDERKALSKLDGIYINRLHEYDEIIRLADKVTDADVKPYLDELDREGIKTTPTAAKLRTFSIKIYLAYKRLAEEHGYDALAISCWPKFQDDYKYSVCSAIGMLNDDKIVAACEGDLMSAISMLALQDMCGESTTLMDFTAFDETDESIMLWHCGPSSKQFCRKNGYYLGENYSGMAHEPGKICGTGVARDMVFDPGKASVFRFGGDMECYLNLTGTFMGNGKDSNCGCRGWMNGLALNGRPVKAVDFANTILSGGFEHHYPVAWGDWSEEVAELNKWLGIKPLREIPYANYLQDKEDQQ